MTTTPPLQASVHVPPTPRHGAKFDTYRPYSHHKVVDRSEPTDLPGTFAPLHRSHTDAKSRLRRGISPSSSNEMLHQAEGNNVTGRRTRNHSLRDSKRQKSPLSADTAAMGSSLDPKNAVSLLLQAPDHGLPTPAKTPRKKAAETSSAISSTARVLFPSNDEDTLPTPQKKGRRSRRHAGFFLDNSFEGPEHEEHIKIFTDSKEKVPELDTTEDNPFYSNPLNEGVSKAWETKSKKNRKTDVTSSQFIEEAFNHEEGMVYVFRGKKFFRKFPKEPLEPSTVSSSEESESRGPRSSRSRPLRRTSIKPRLLFPTQTQRHDHEIAEEEALTDIEQLPDALNDAAMTTKEPRDDRVVNNLNTPVKGSFAPTSPPSTGHATRAATKRAELDRVASPARSSEPVDDLFDTRPQRKKTRSPFDTWQRTKPGISGSGTGQKRKGDLLEQDPEVAGDIKKVKSNSKA